MLATKSRFVEAEALLVSLQVSVPALVGFVYSSVHRGLLLVSWSPQKLIQHQICILLKNPTFRPKDFDLFFCVHFEYIFVLCEALQKRVEVFIPEFLVRLFFVVSVVQFETFFEHLLVRLDFGMSRVWNQLFCSLILVWLV